MDIYLAIVPKLEPFAPTTGPGLLKAHCEAEGFSAIVRDWNIDLYNWLKDQGLAKHYFETNDEGFISWFNVNYEYPKEWYELYDLIQPKLQTWVDDIKSLNPRWVGLSMLSSVSVNVGRKMCELLREQAPEIKIVIGGAAVRKENQMWLDKGWIDYYIYGDGEFSIVDLLKGNLDAPGINSTEPCQVQDLNKTLIPDYEDIDWRDYELNEEMSPIYITASRGCVKRCTFCDVPLLWPTYKWRSADHVFNEIKTMHEKHGRRMFRFTDSLINGSMSQFRGFLEKIVEFNYTQHLHMDEIRWWSQWIIRPKSQMLEKDFELMANSNCKEVDIGLESFSESVRWHMGKKFSDEDLWWNLEMMNKYNIKYTLLMITGYPTETLEDHEHTKACLQRMYDLGYIKNSGNSPSDAFLSFGNTMMIQPDYKIYKMLKDDPDFHYGQGSVDWTYKDNTPEERMRRHLEIQEIVGKLTKQQDSWMIAKQIRQDLEEIRKHRHAQM